MPVLVERTVTTERERYVYQGDVAERTERREEPIRRRRARGRRMFGLGSFEPAAERTPAAAAQLEDYAAYVDED